MCLRTFWWNFKWIRMMSHHHNQLQLKHSCTTTSHGLSQMARKKRMFFRTFFTWNNTFFATFVHQATKQEHMGCFFVQAKQLYVHVHFKWVLKERRKINLSLHKKNVLENVLLKLQQDKDDILIATISQLAYSHACALSKTAGTQRMFWRRFCNSQRLPFWALLRIKQ